MSKPVVVFSGGRGTARVVDALLRCKSQGILDVELTLLVNAYDNGQSTGLVRRLFGILGPSDVRKTMKTLLDVSGQGGQAVADFFELRFGDEDDNDKGSEWPILEAMAQDHSEFLSRFRKGQIFLGLSERHRELVRSGLSAFLKVAASHREAIDLGDLSLMNAVFSGLTGGGGDLQTAINLFSSELPLRGRVLLNSPENLYLYAVREYRPNLNVPLVLDEADVVSLRSSVRIQSIYLLREPLSEEERTELSSLPQGEAQRVLQSRSAGIEGNPLARQALRDADVILYGPGTQFSSLLPSYMTEGFGEAIAANPRARKIRFFRF